MLKDPVRCGELCRVCVRVAVWPVRCADTLCVRVGFTVACVRMAVCVCGGVAGVAVRVCARERGARGGPPFFCGVQAAVSYSPTPWRVQYHRRWQS